MKVLIVLAAVLLSIGAVNAQGNGAVRLNDNGNVDPSNTQGVVEVYYNGEWGSICGSYSVDNIPDVVCHQLGYTGGYSGSSNSGSVNTSPVLSSVSCDNDDYLTILQCEYLTVTTGCSSSDYIQVTCYTTRLWDSPYTGMVRLQGGYYSGQGRVEVYCNGQWGVVCNSGLFDGDAASTICTQLGYNDQVTFSSVSYSGTAWLDNVNCYYQSCLSQCSGGNCPSSSVYCSYAANVTCEYSTTSTSWTAASRYTCDLFNPYYPLRLGVIVAIVLGVLFTAFVCITLAIVIPLCICCCCGIGIGAATSRSSRVYYDQI